MSFSVATIDERRNAIVVHSAAGPAAILVGSPWRRCERDGQIGPVDQVSTGDVAPVDVSMDWACRVILVEQVILALPLDQSIRIVEPIAWCHDVILGTVW